MEGLSDILHNAVTNHVPGQFDRVASVFASCRQSHFSTAYYRVFINNK